MVKELCNFRYKKWSYKILIFIAFLVSAQSYAQHKVTLSEKQAPLIKVLNEIKKQTGFSYILTSDLIESAPRITIEVRNMELVAVLERIFKTGPIKYIIIKRTIVMRKIQ